MRGKAIYVMAGPHAVVVQKGEERVERLVEVRADATVSVGGLGSENSSTSTSTSTGTSTSTSTTRDSGTGHGHAYGGEGGARSRLVLHRARAHRCASAGVTLVSGLDALSKHDSFDSRLWGAAAPG